MKEALEIRLHYSGEKAGLDNFWGDLQLHFSIIHLSSCLRFLNHSLITSRTVSLICFPSGLEVLGHYSSPHHKERIVLCVLSQNKLCHCGSCSSAFVAIVSLSPHHPPLNTRTNDTLNYFTLMHRLSYIGVTGQMALREQLRFNLV